ncbi:MAG: hypothetical protein OFPI_04280 [Osedax symbiont Rs2]|nr:MAG: hypothetical protein OFPI_04280 [Osedax symbiont Rs2]
MNQTSKISIKANHIIVGLMVGAGVGTLLGVGIGSFIDESLFGDAAKGMIYGMSIGAAIGVAVGTTFSVFKPSK